MWLLFWTVNLKLFVLANFCLLHTCFPCWTFQSCFSTLAPLKTFVQGSMTELWASLAGQCTSLSHCVFRLFYWQNNLLCSCTRVSWVLCVLITIYSSEAILPFSVSQSSTAHSFYHDPNALAESCACGRQALWIIMNKKYIAGTFWLVMEL